MSRRTQGQAGPVVKHNSEPLEFVPELLEMPFGPWALLHRPQRFYSVSFRGQIWIWDNILAPFWKLNWICGRSTFFLPFTLISIICFKNFILENNFREKKGVLHKISCPFKNVNLMVQKDYCPSWFWTMISHRPDYLMFIVK